MDRLLIWYLFFAILTLALGIALVELIICPASEQLSTIIEVSFC